MAILKQLNVFSLKTALLVSTLFSCRGFTATWNLNANGNWNVNGNWTAPAIFPNAVDATAQMLNIITANRVITLGQNITIGTLIFDDNNNYNISGVNTLIFNVSGGTANLGVTNMFGNGAHTISCPVSLQDDLVMTHGSPANMTISGAISGVGGIRKTGNATGAFVLSNGSNSYTGATVVADGNLNYQANGAIPAVSPVTIGGGLSSALLRINATMTVPNAFDVTIESDGTLFQANNQSVQLLSLAGSGTVNMSTGTGASNFINISGDTNTSFSGLISGGAASASTDPTMGNRLLKSGNSTLTLTSANNFISRTFLQDGVINVQNNSALGPSGTNSAAYVQNDATLEIEDNITLVKTLRLNGTGFNSMGAIRNVSGTNTISGPIQLGWSGGPVIASNPTIRVENGSTLISNNIISGSNDLTLIGEGTLQYTGTLSNTYMGTTILNEGTLNLNKSGGATAIAGDIEIDGGTLIWSQPEQVANTATITQNSGMFLLNNQNETISRYVVNSGVGLFGGGTLELLDPVTALSMRGTGALEEGTLRLSGTGVVFFDATDNGTAGIATFIDLDGGNRTFDISNGTADIDMFIDNTIFNGALTKEGAGTLQLTGVNSYLGGTTISAGTIIGTTLGIQGDIVNNANLVFDQDFTGNYTGALSGTGTVVKQGSDAVTFLGSNDNTYTGLTTILNGTLNLNRAGFTSISGDVSLEGGTLFWLQSDQIADSRSITQSGGIFNLNGNSEGISSYTYNAGTSTLSGGSLFLLNPVTNLTMRDTTISGTGTIFLLGAGDVVFDNVNNGTASIECDIDLDGAIRTFNVGTSTAPSGMLITGRILNGGFIKIGMGTLELLGMNGYGSGATVSGGTLKGNTDSIIGNTVNNANLVFDQTFDGLYSGMISGTGTFVKEGSESLTLTNTNTTGMVTVEEGTLIVNNSLSGAGDFIVEAGTTLRGTGPINKDITNNGTINPGGSIGTMTVVGDVTFASGSMYAVELNPTTSDLLDVTGSVTIDASTTLSIFPVPDVYTTPFTYLVIDTSGGVTGTFSSVVSALPLFDSSAIYTPTQVLLEVQIIPVGTLVGTGNAAPVAACLDSLDPSPDSDLGVVFAAITHLPTQEAIEQALLQLQPSAFTSLSVAQQNNSVYVRNAVALRLDKILDSCFCECTPFSLWFAPFGGFTKQENRRDEPGYSYFTPGLIVGIDGAPLPCFSFGFGFGYSYSHFDWKRSRGKANLDSAYGTIYWQIRNSCNYLQAIILGGYTRYTVDRKIDFGTSFPIKRRALSNQKGGEIGARAKTGWIWCTEKYNFSPFVSIDYYYLHNGSFKEKGADSLDLKVKSRSADILLAEIGIDLSYCYKKCYSKLVPFAKVSYILEKRFEGKKVRASLEGCPLVVRGFYPTRSLVGADLGLDLSINCFATISLMYQGKYNRNFQDHSFYFEIGRTF